jgi:hypothetical protein
MRSVIEGSRPFPRDRMWKASPAMPQIINASATI